LHALSETIAALQRSQPAQDGYGVMSTHAGCPAATAVVPPTAEGGVTTSAAVPIEPLPMLGSPEPANLALRATKAPYRTDCSPRTTQRRRACGTNGQSFRPRRPRPRTWTITLSQSRQVALGDNRSAFLLALLATRSALEASRARRPEGSPDHPPQSALVETLCDAMTSLGHRRPSEPPLLRSNPVNVLSRYAGRKRNCRPAIAAGTTSTVRPWRCPWRSAHSAG
jgi:hypothetical protein